MQRCVPFSLLVGERKLMSHSFENTLSRKRARVKPKFLDRKLPRPVCWERAGVRAISSSPGVRKLMNHFVVNHSFSPAVKRALN